MGRQEAIDAADAIAVFDFDIGRMRGPLLGPSHLTISKSPCMVWVMKG